MGDGLMIQERSSVNSIGRVAQILISEAYLGGVINALAKPIDDQGKISALESRGMMTWRHSHLPPAYHR
ncbi:hypothetical protein Lal_00023430 [Lupinus albus]|nr:hypothetical protein Lal_00023430 [Lupinus albus]